MPTLITSLSSNGVLFTTQSFDEVTYTTNKLTPDAVYSGLFDEVTGTGSAAVKQTTGELFVKNYFDEITINPIEINYLIVGGGGTGGSPARFSSLAGGGGGGGGVLTGVYVLSREQITQPIIVGLGGTSVTRRGSNSVAFNLSAIGGGSGFNAGIAVSSLSGGSGGGTTTTSTVTGGAGIPGQGNDGGHSRTAGYAGGGGGAGSVGGAGTSTTSGPGGNGILSYITGLSAYYGGGGGGGRTAAAGGLGGGGTGGSPTGTAGTINTGGGGGGGFGTGPITTFRGGLGGSGIVILSYQSPVQLYTGGTITSYVSAEKTFWVHSFTTSGAFNRL